MLIASKLKKTNICEYLLYMWQIEDLIRAFKLDMSQIETEIIAQLKLKGEAEYKAVYEWYESLIEMMRLENIQETGHLQLNKNVIIDLDDFHTLMLRSEKVPSYQAKFYHILPLINQFRNKSASGLSDLELCFTFQYGFLLLKLKKSTITPETKKAQSEISKFMVLLAKNYQAYKNGELDLE